MVHTSAATVIVLPEAEEFDVDLNMQDVRIERTTSTGPGGQSVNTTYSAIKLHHEPTGMIVSCQDQKSSHKNLEKALKVLRSRLYEMELAKKLLSENSYNVNEVSIKLGYSTSSHFITAFKNKYGLTPKNFKKNY